jgi:polysaccharide export outer membrane protein
MWGKFVRKHRALGKTSIVATILSVLIVALNAAVGPAARAQDASDQQQASQLSVGDWVSIKVSGQPDATSYVGGDGTVSVPLIGNIPVAGTSPLRAAARIAKSLKEGGYFVDPQVTIAVTAPTSQFASVVGEVHNQGRFPITA